MIHIQLDLLPLRPANLENILITLVILHYHCSSPRVDAELALWLLGSPTSRHICQDSPSESRLQSHPSTKDNPQYHSHSLGENGNTSLYYSSSMEILSVEASKSISNTRLPSDSRQRVDKGV